MPEQFPAPNADQALAQVRIKPYDVLNVSVYQEPDLSVNSATVDPSGNLMMPIIGEVPAANLTPAELGRDIAQRFGSRLLVNPQITVQRTGGLLDRVTVTGSVQIPGIYELKGPTTLLDSIALAKGLTNVARRGDVAIIRQIDGRRAGAIFNVSAIERGEIDDPAVLPSDKIVVGTSAIRQGYRDLLSAAPLIGIVFRYF